MSEHELKGYKTSSNIGPDNIERGIVEGQIREIFPTSIDLKVGQKIRFFIDNRGDEPVFIKQFEGSTSEADSEIENVQKLVSVDKGVLIVPLIGHSREGDLTAVSYPFVEGEDLQLRLENLKASDELMPIATEALHQVILLSTEAEKLKLKEYVVTPRTIIGYPFDPEIFLDEEFAKVNSAYTTFWVLRKNISSAYPGYSLDRHPRNFLVDAEGKMHHIDFEIIVKDSPLFDLVKITRNGPAQEFPVTKGDWEKLATDPEAAFWNLNPFTADQEEELINRFRHERFPNDTNSPEFYRAVYDTVSAHTHLMYISKYWRRYLALETGQRDIAESRMYYHLVGYLALKNRLVDITQHFGESTKGVSNSVTAEQIQNLNHLIEQLAIKFSDEHE